MNAVSDAMVASAFFTTAFVLGFFVWRRRRDVMFRGVFWAFAIFATVCGVTRLLSILTLWVPAYDIEGLIKGFLALTSVGITAALLLLLPRILVLPTRIQLQQAYAALEEEIRQRRNAEAMVKRFQEIEANEAQVATKSPPQVMSFLKAYFRRGTNYDCDQIGQLLYRFDSAWGRAFESFVEKNNAIKEGISSCYAVRNSVAHGGGGSLGPSVLRQYYDASFTLIANLEYALR